MANKLALICLPMAIGLGAILFRLSAFFQYSPLPTGFDGPLVFRERYLLTHQHFLTATTLKVYSFWSGGALSQLGIYLQEALFAAVIQVAAWTRVPVTLVHQVILSIALISLSLILLFQGLKGHRPALHAAIISLFITLGSPTIILYITGWDSAYGWVLFLAVTVISLSRLSIRWKVVLTLILTVLGPPLYHTFGFYLNIYSMLLWVVAWLFGYRRIIVSPIAVIVCYLGYQIYISTLFFHELARGVADVVSLSFLHRDHRNVIISAVKVGFIDLRYLNLILYVLTVIPIVITSYRAYGYLKERRQRTGSWLGLARTPDELSSQEPLYQAATVAATLSVAAFALMFGAKFGIEQMINRGAEYLTLPTILAVATELRYHRRRAVYLYPLATVILSVSCYSFLIQSMTAFTSTRMTLSEAQGYAWVARQMRPEDTVFTDFRLSGPFIADGHFRVIGITGQGKEKTQHLLQGIYYHPSPRSLTGMIDELKTYDNRRATYLFLSTQMLKVYPGLIGFDNHYKPASPQLFSAVAHSPDWRLVYQNSQIRIYHRTLQTSAGNDGLQAKALPSTYESFGYASAPAAGTKASAPGAR